MKLGILCTMINGFGRKGYYNSQEIGLGRALARMGHQVLIYKGVYPEDTEERVTIETGLEVWYLPMRHFGAHGWMDSNKLDPEMEGLFCFGDQQLFLPHIERWCRKHGVCFVPYIGTAHSLYTNFKSHVTNTLFAMGTLKIYKTHPVLAKTEAAKQELTRLGVTDITVAPVGLDTAVLKQDFHQADRAALRRKFGLSENDVVLCNVSRLSAEKRTLELIDVFMCIHGKKPFKLIIVGDGELRDALRKKIKDCGVEQEVTLLPNVPYPDMWEVYVVSDYYLNMNKGEIFGMAIMEAMYYERSVAAIRAIGPSVTMKDMKGHKLCADDAEVAQWVLEDYPSQADLAESAHKIAENFSWNRCAKAFLGVIAKSKK